MVKVTVKIKSNLSKSYSQNHIKITFKISETLNFKTFGNRCKFFSQFFALFSLFSSFLELFSIKEYEKITLACTFLENKDMSCVMRYKSNWDSNITGVSSSEAVPYLLLWHFIKNKIQTEHYFCAFLKR